MSFEPTRTLIDLKLGSPRHRSVPTGDHVSHGDAGLGRPQHAGPRQRDPRRENLRRVRPSADSYGPSIVFCRWFPGRSSAGARRQSSSTPCWPCGATSRCSSTLRLATCTRSRSSVSVVSRPGPSTSWTGPLRIVRVCTGHTSLTRAS